MADRPSAHQFAPRTLVPELMDDPALGQADHEQALGGLSRLNAASLADRPLWQTIQSCLRSGERLSVLDVAAGGGDVPARIHTRATRAGAAGVLDWHVCDLSARAVELAQRRLRNAGAARVVGFTHNIVQDPLPSSFDVVTCSLFLHHLTKADAVHALRHMAGGAARCLIVNDLRRSTRGLALAAVASRVLSRSSIVHTDAVLSARAAWSIDEARALAADAGLDGAEVVARWPSRWLMVWRRA